MQGATPRIKSRSHLCHPMYRHGVRCEGVEPLREAQCVVAMIGKYGMGHLASGVNAGVGTTSTMKPYGSPVELKHCPFQSALDGGKPGLDLPAGKVRAVVFDINAGSPGHGG
jgi:hypothetical protein